MADFDAETLAEQARLIGLVTDEQVSRAREAAEDGSLASMSRAFLRKQFLTSWQLDKLLKGETQGFFFGPCKVLFHIAEGTFARVYRGVKTPSLESVAVKVLRQRFVSDPEAIVRFNKEAEAGLKLEHPNIVRIFDYGGQDGRAYMTMEYVEGSNLRDFLKIRTRLRPGEALPLLLGLARGLQFSLSKGVTHRDLKPTNILVSSNGIAKLVDFGLATIEGDQKKMAVAHGQRTVDYSALERTCGSPKGDPRSDIFFLGCVFYQMLTGNNPMPDADSKDPLVKMLKRNISAIKPLSDHHHAPPEELSRIIEKMMKVDLKTRYQTMDAVVADLEAYQASLASEVSKAADRGKPTAKPAIEEVVGDDLDVFEDAAFEVNILPTAVVRPPAAQAQAVLCVEVQETVRGALLKVLQDRGLRVTLAGDLPAAAGHFRESPPDLLLFDADGLGSQAVDAFRGLRDEPRDGKSPMGALLLLSPKQAAVAGSLPEGERLVVLTKPLKMKDILEALDRLVPAG